MTTKELRPREESDHYPTPKELIGATFKEVSINIEPQYILDPGAGAGVYGEVAKELWPNVYTVGIEIDDTFKKPECYNDWKVADFRDDPLQHSYITNSFDLVIGNPPYGQVQGIKDRKLAEKIVKISWEYLRPEGYIIFLLRLGFLAGQQRMKNFWPKYPLKDVYALSRRPSFTGNGKTDANEYGIFVWQKGYTGPTYMKWLQWNYDEAVS